MIFALSWLLDRMRIVDNKELIRRHNDGQGFIYNDFGNAVGWNEEENNKLHKASCRWISKMNTSTPKYFFKTLSAATKWLNMNRLGKYSLCKVCQPR